ncbi:histidine phosphatase family protein [Cuniculiplasma sp. SKW4]|uniref:histidine phosphatase family protein n=1 Tax=Cuniculiplasma sp. SKW4 TaxID=3400171 RepID=UPI003FD07EDC
MDIIFLRHGKTVWNATGRWQGHTDVPLSEEGRYQAKKAAELLKKERIDTIFSSDLKRAYETAKIVGEIIGKDEILVDKRLRERNLGDMEGKTTNEIGIMVGNEVNIVDIVGSNLPINNLESVEDQFRRAEEFLNSIKGKFQSVLIVSHGVMIGIMINILTDEDFRYRKIDNCEIIKIKTDLY